MKFLILNSANSIKILFHFLFIVILISTSKFNFAKPEDLKFKEYLYHELLSDSNTIYGHYIEDLLQSSENLDQIIYEEKSILPSNACENEICQDAIFKWHSTKHKNIYVGGIFPMVGGWPGGQACLPSAIMALNEVNLNHSMLPGYRLNLKWFNSEVLFN